MMSCGRPVEIYTSTPYFFAFLPTIGEAIAIVLGLMRSNVWLTGSAMLAGKTLRYIVVLATFRGALSLF